MENLVTGNVQQSIPSLTSETQPMACRESSAYYVVPIVVKKRYLVPIQKNVGGFASHTYDITSLSVVCKSDIHRQSPVRRQSHLFALLR